MSEIKLDKNLKQEEFVNNVSGNVLLSASAGSGKTTTMIKKLLTLIKDQGLNVRDFLVLTFTDAASSEMKQKLFNALQNSALEIEELIKNDSEEKTGELELLKTKQQNIFKALEDINFSDIGTFHSVFKKFITKYFYNLDIDPAFTIVSDQEQKILLNKAITNVFNSYIISQDLSFYTLQETFNKKRQDTAFRELVINLYYLSKEKVDFSLWFEGIIEKSYNTNINENQAVVFLVEQVKKLLFKEVENLNNGVLISNNLGFEKVIEHFEFLLGQVKNVLSVNDNQSFLNYLFDIESFKTLNFPRKLEPEHLDLVAQLKQLNDQHKELIKDVKKMLITNDVEFFENSTKLTKQLLYKIKEIIEFVDKDYKKLKDKKSQLDFNDLQQLTLQLLQNDVVQKELQKQYKYIFVDEFQDVNEIQNHILSKINNGHNLNMIGDIKQSIYEFRLASPKIFLDVLNSFKRKKSNGKVIDLNKNYRSSNNILQFVNYLFKVLITKDTVGIDYEKTSMLESGKDELLKYDKTNNAKGINNVELVLINKIESSKQNNDEQNLSDETFETNVESQIEDLNQKQLEAEVVAQKIMDLIGKPFYNVSKNQEDKINYKDIAILTRDNGEFVSVLYETLVKYKIPTYAVNKNNIFKTNEVMHLFNYLKLLNNPLNDYALVSVMLSRIGKFTHNELATIRLINNTKKTAFYDCVDEFLQEGSFEKVNKFVSKPEWENIVSKLQDFFNVLNDFRNGLKNLTVYETLKQVILKFDLQNYYFSLPQGNMIVNNLNEFLELTNTQSFKHNLVQCVNYLNELSKKDDFKVAVSEGSNAVTILTMHKSKGLEFPAVILCELGKKFSNNSSRQELVFSENLGVAIKLKDIVTRYEKHTLQFNASVLEKQLTEIKEQIRLLYVATTRPKNYLYMVGSVSNKTYGKVLNMDLLNAGSFLELILKTFSKQDLESLISGQLNLVVNPKEFGKCNVTCVNYEDIVLSKEESFSVKINNPINLKYVEKLNQVFSKKYEKIKNVSIKNSVTSILTEQDYVSKNTAPKLLKTTEIKPDSSLSLKLGIAYHIIMQNLTYHENKEQVVQLIESFVEKGLIDLQVVQLIKVEQIVNAISAIKGLIKPNSVILKEQQFVLQDAHSNLVEGSAIAVPIIVQGVIDLIVINNDQTYVIDFKTNKNTSVKALLEIYSLQLSIYEQAVKNAYSFNNVKKAIYSFELNELIWL